MKKMLITGATSGIGKALAIHAADSGYQVIACGRNEEVLSTLSEHKYITPLQFDVTSEEKAAAALGNVTCDIAVLNAGTCEYVDIEKFEPDMFRRVFEPNFFGVVHCVNGLLPQLQRGNKLVIVDSMGAFTSVYAYASIRCK